jgi:hypothetical protein
MGMPPLKERPVNDHMPVDSAGNNLPTSPLIASQNERELPLHGQKERFEVAIRKMSDDQA